MNLKLARKWFERRIANEGISDVAAGSLGKRTCARCQELEAEVEELKLQRTGFEEQLCRLVDSMVVLEARLASPPIAAVVELLAGFNDWRCLDANDADDQAILVRQAFASLGKMDEFDELEARIARREIAADSAHRDYQEMEARAAKALPLLEILESALRDSDLLVRLKEPLPRLIRDAIRILRGKA